MFPLRYLRARPIGSQRNVTGADQSVEMVVLPLARRGLKTIAGYQVARKTLHQQRRFDGFRHSRRALLQAQMGIDKLLWWKHGVHRIVDFDNGVGRRAEP